MFDFACGLALDVIAEASCRVRNIREWLKENVKLRAALKSKGRHFPHYEDHPAISSIRTKLGVKVFRFLKRRQRAGLEIEHVTVRTAIKYEGDEPDRGLIGEEKAGVAVAAKLLVDRPGFPPDVDDGLIIPPYELCDIEAAPASKSRGVGEPRVGC